MPKATRSAEDIEAVKQDILTHAMKLINEEGFTRFSMRGLASKTGMTAANIYNYYTNKDELYLAIQTRGFELLFNRFEQAYRENEFPLDRLRAMIQSYIDFGISGAHYYDIMFNMNTPKYMDYIGTGMEPSAWIEKQTALKTAAITARVLGEIAESTPALKNIDPQYHTLQLWTSIHGIVTLFNSRVIQEVSTNTTETIQRLIEDLLLPFTGDT
ncbi:MAG: TetR/AcrR family transcriptional regulator [bacterium]|nr:TetR/AcrR family transcriptional regulator [bacterium]